jgi:hypothetical protein
MKKVYALILFLLVLSCKKEEKPEIQMPACMKNNTATIVVANLSNNPYRIFINNEDRGMQAGQTEATYTVPAAFIQLRSVQLSGYLLYPSEFTGTTTMEMCSTKRWSFP